MAFLSAENDKEFPSVSDWEVSSPFSSLLKIIPFSFKGLTFTTPGQVAFLKALSNWQILTLITRE